jgi:DNA mismatch repair protein MSH2
MAKRKADELEDFSGKQEASDVRASKEEVEEGTKLLKEILSTWKEQVEAEGLGKDAQIQRMKELVKGNEALLANPFFQSVKAL